MPDPDVHIKPFRGMTLRELHACYKLRGEVFVVGQQICSEPDIDEVDPLCHHVMAWAGEELAGTARLLPIDDGQTVKVGRVAVALGYQRKGVGSAMMQAIQAWIDRAPGRGGVMSAQAYLEPWYTSLGWKPEGEHYLEAGIDHITMRRDPVQ